jgi:hypothetical protein
VEWVPCVAVTIHIGIQILILKEAVRRLRGFVEGMYWLYWQFNLITLIARCLCLAKSNPYKLNESDDKIAC